MAILSITTTGADVMAHGPIADSDVHGPARRTATWTPSDAGPTIEADFELRNGAAHCTAVRFAAQPDGRDVQGADLAGLRLEALAEQVLSEVTTTVTDGVLSFDDDPDATTRARPHVQRARRAARRRLTDQDLDLVRRVYRSALANGENTAQAVAKQFEIAPRTAGDYIKRARGRKFLGPSLGRGKPGEQTDPPTNTTTKG